MISRISKFALFCFLLVSCNEVKEKPGIAQNDYVSREHLIEAKELAGIFEDKNIKIVDFRSPENYQTGHIYGSINIWRTDVSDNSLPYQGIRADKENIERLFSRSGIENNDLIIIYDDKGSSDAARLWCILDEYNFDSVKILNGGLKSWVGTGEKLTVTPVKYDPTQFILPEKGNEDIWIDKEELISLLGNEDSNIIIVDSRSSEEYSGTLIKKGASKAGRIPNSIHIDWAEAIDLRNSKKFRSIEELQVLYNALEMNLKDTVVVYCHTGYRSSLTTFVLQELMGFENVRNYDGSWVEWSFFDELPYEKDSLIL